MKGVFRITLIFAGCFLFISCKNDGDSLTWIGIMVTLIPILSAVAVYAVQHFNYLSRMFISYAERLHSDKESDQIASAVLLRTFLDNASFAERTLSLFVSLLKILPNGNLQKVLGDSLSKVKNADGYDFQKVNVHNVLIKPQSYIKYDLTANNSLLNDRISFRGADFYQSNMTELNACSVNFSNAVFFEAQITDARFRNCVFKDANFRMANLSGTVFSECVLDGAIFKGARGLSNAVVRKKSDDTDNNYINVPLINFLDADGCFYTQEQKEVVYIENVQREKIFVSKLGLMDSVQQMHYDRIIQYLKDTYNVDIVCLDRKDYLRFGQLSSIKDKIASCSGFVAFAFSYLYVTDACLHKNLSSPYKEEKSKSSFSSPWIQIEVAFANSIKIPTLIVIENDVVAEGIFDDMIINNDSHLYKFKYNGALIDADKSVIKDWYHKIECK